MKKENELKTADYTRKAIDKYRDGKTTISILVTPDIIQAIKSKYGDGVKIATYIKELINKDLNGGGEKSAPLPWDK